MSLAARNPSKGDHVFNEYVEYIRGCRNGDTIYEPGVYDSRNLMVHHCRKEGSNSPVRFLSGGYPWRDPTTYARGVADFHWGKEKWTYVDGSFSCELDAGYPDDNLRHQQVPEKFYWNGPFGVNSTELEYEASYKALQKIKDQKMGMGENIAQARQTFGMIEDAGLTLLRAALAAKRGNIGEVGRILRDGRSMVRRGSDLFLQYKYGWKPLMSDIYGLHELLKQRLKPPLIVSGYGRSSVDSFHMNPTGLQRGSGSGTQQAQCKLYALVSSDTLHIADQVGLSNPLRLAWDLIPFSFVVDWVAPIGPMLDSLLPPAGLEFLGGFAGLKTQVSCTSYRDPVPPYGGPAIENRFQGYSYDRRKLTTWPQVGLWFIKNPFSLSNGLSAFTLFLQKNFR